MGQDSPSHNIVKGKKKGKIRHITDHEGSKKELRYSATLSSTSALEGCGSLTPRPCHFTPERDTVPTVQEAGWAVGPVWTNKENLAPTGITSADRPAHSESSQLGTLHNYSTR